mgnify:CR=1 FL=1
MSESSASQSTLFPDGPRSAILADQFASRAPSCDPSNPKSVTEIVEFILTMAVEAGASDIHFTVNAQELQVLWRVDGVLQLVSAYTRSLAPNFIARLKVLAELLTYRTDVPQEGRLRESPGKIEMRLSTFPTLYGEKAVVRIFANSNQYRWPGELGLPDDLLPRLVDFVHETAGAVLFTGPAGSGWSSAAVTAEPRC